MKNTTFKMKPISLALLLAGIGLAPASYAVDLVAIDLPLMAAIECRMCGECAREERCPIAVEEADSEYAVRRIVNLMGAWHNQLLELMGAMGIREARRLRGETGRCLFFDDLERNTFGKLFGKRKVNNRAAAVWQRCPAMIPLF